MFGNSGPFLRILGFSFISFFYLFFYFIILFILLSHYFFIFISLFFSFCFFSYNRKLCFLFFTGALGLIRLLQLLPPAGLYLNSWSRQEFLNYTLISGSTQGNFLLRKRESADRHIIKVIEK